jgi:phytoene dehydrogenase-like protein
MVGRTIADTAGTLGKDGKAYRRLFRFLVSDWEKILEDMLGPLPLPPHHPLADLLFGMAALLPARTLAQSWFSGPNARALLGGLAAHSILPLERPATSAFGLMLGMLAQAVGWPFARGGSRRVGEALVAHLKSLGGEIETGCEVHSLADLPPARAVLMDVTPRQLVRIAGNSLPVGYLRQLERFRYGPGVFKVDWALSGPVPWKAGGLEQAGTVHLGGTLEEISASERAVWHGQHPERPYTILVQATPFDPSRAPTGKHTAWAYCHVPNGSTVDMTARIEAQVEHFAPGFRDLILARSVKNAADLEAYNPNYVGGDINGGVQDLSQLFTRPTPRVLVPYATPVKGLYLCSSSTPPGGGVHGMCGVHAAYAALAGMFK